MHFKLLLFFIFFWLGLYAAPNRPYDSDYDLRHQLNNLQADVRTFEEKMATQEEIVEELRKQQAEASKLLKESMCSQSNTMSSKLSQHEADLKTRSNSSQQNLADLYKRISILEKIVEQQNSNFENMKAALQS